MLLVSPLLMCQVSNVTSVPLLMCQVSNVTSVPTIDVSGEQCY